MKYDVTFIATDDYLPTDGDPQWPAGSNDAATGEAPVFATFTFNVQETVFQLLAQLFGGKLEPIELYSDESVRVLDLSPVKDRLIKPELLNGVDPALLGTTEGEANVLAELFAALKNGLHKNYLLMVVSNEEFLS